MEIGVVIVTYNRLNKLIETLNQFSKQTKSPAYVLIVNNASTDGTMEYLAEWQTNEGGCIKIVLNLEENTGGSGGFYEGLKASLDLDADWVWVSDDDAVPECDALEKAYQYLNSSGAMLENISAICGQVINYGEIDINHRKNYITKGIRIIECPVPREEYQKDQFELNAFSYVGTIISRDKMKLAGVTRKEYFIWWDDTEHSLRLSKIGKIICVPAIRIHHDTAEEKNVLSWKSYYGYRNMTDLYHRHMPWYCFWYFSLKVIIKTLIFPIFKINRYEIMILRESFWDALKNNFGLHPIYRPGWNFDKQRK